MHFRAGHELRRRCRSRDPRSCFRRNDEVQTTKDTKNTKDNELETISLDEFTSRVVPGCHRRERTAFSCILFSCVSCLSWFSSLIDSARRSHRLRRAWQGSSSCNGCTRYQPRHLHTPPELPTIFESVAKLPGAFSESRYNRPLYFCPFYISVHVFSHRLQWRPAKVDRIKSTINQSRIMAPACPR